MAKEPPGDKARSKDNPAKDPAAPPIRTFLPGEAAAGFRLRSNPARTDMERFRLLCRLMRIHKIRSQSKQ